MNLFRRIPLYRLLLLCGSLLAIGVSATALAFALDTGPKPAPKPLAQAVHDALSGAGKSQIQGVSAEVKLTNHLLEGASLASGDGQGGGLTSSPLLSGATGRLWIAKDGRMRLELQAEKGDTQLLYDRHTLELYDASSNTLYRYTPPKREDGSSSSSDSVGHGDHEAPSVAKVEEAISHLRPHANVSGATPDNVAGRPAYTVRISPKENGSLIGGAELSWDAENGVPLRTAIYSVSSASPVIELAASSISYAPVPDSVFAFTPPASAKVVEVHLSKLGTHTHRHTQEEPKLTTHGHGVSTIAVLEEQAAADQHKSDPSRQLEALPKVDINGTSASELRTELGTLLTFERSGVRYLLAGWVPPSAIEALARGL